MKNKIIQDLKIKEDLWNLIVSGKKTREFRKLTKGLASGTYRFISIERDMTLVDCGYCYECDMGFKCSHITPKDEPIKIFGTATLTPYHFYGMNCNWDLIAPKKIDEETFWFVFQNYCNKHDFMAYYITSVKDLRNE